MTGRAGLGGRVLLLAAGVAAVALLPLYISNFRASEFALVGIFFIALTGLNVLTGFTGQISLGHGAFMAVGGYTTAILVSGGPDSEQPLDLWPGFLEGGVRDLWTIPLAGVVAGIVGFLFGIPALRLTGVYLALATFSIAVAAPALFREAENVTGGNSGIQLFGAEGLSGQGFAEIDVFGRSVSFYDFVYYLSWSIAGLGLVAAWLLLRGRAGRAFKAVRESEVAAASSGVNVAAYKTLAFAVSAFYAGVAGALLAIQSTIVSPASYPVALSIFLVIGVVVAGLGRLSGLLFGALFVVFLPIGIRELAGVASLPARLQDWANDPGVPSVIFGAALILAMFLLPSGAAGLPGRLVKQLTSRR